jgi:hypothetical protein
VEGVQIEKNLLFLRSLKIDIFYFFVRSSKSFFSLLKDNSLSKIFNFLKFVHTPPPSEGVVKIENEPFSSFAK